MDVGHIAKLANLPLTTAEENKFSIQFEETLQTVGLINELDTSQVKSTSQVTGLVNVTRPDEINPDRILSQAQALSQASKSFKGYFVVPAVFDEA